MPKPKFFELLTFNNYQNTLPETWFIRLMRRWTKQIRALELFGEKNRLGRGSNLGQAGGNLCLWGPERFFSIVRNAQYTYPLFGRAIFFSSHPLDLLWVDLQWALMTQAVQFQECFTWNIRKEKAKVKNIRLKKGKLQRSEKNKREKRKEIQKYYNAEYSLLLLYQNLYSVKLLGD